MFNKYLEVLSVTTMKFYLRSIVGYSVQYQSTVPVDVHLALKTLKASCVRSRSVRNLYDSLKLKEKMKVELESVVRVVFSKLLEPGFPKCWSWSLESVLKKWGV